MGNRFLRPFLPSFFFLFALLGVHAFAQETSQNSRPDTLPDYASRQALANRYVHEVLPYWQHRLQLEDWNVYVLLSRPADLRPGTLGNIHWDMEKKTATIRVMDSSGYPADLVPMLNDMQVTIVHELVHLELASLPVSEADRSNQEFAIDHITDALLRGDTRTPSSVEAKSSESTQ